MADVAETTPFRIGEWTVNPTLDRIEGLYRTVAVKPRAMDLLVYLARNAGQVVSSDELAQVVWHDNVITDSAIYQNITQLRRALGDDAQNPRFLETIPKKGYRLIAKVRFLEPDELPVQPIRQASSSPRGISRGLRYVLAGLFVIVTSDYSGLLQSDSATARATVSERTAAIGSVAVLPFVDLSPDEEQSYLGEGIAEELLHSLANVPDLRVAARTSAFSFQDSNADIQTIGERLNVDAVLEGSVRKSGDGLRVTVQLIDTSDGYHLWSKTFDGELSDIFDIENEIAITVAQAVASDLPEKSVARMAKTPTHDIAAYDYYLLGRHYMFQRTPSSVVRAVDLFRQAIGADPDFALAYAGLSQAYFFQRHFTQEGYYDPELEVSAEIAARHALEMDDQLAEAHVAMANVYMLKHNWSGAESAYRSALDLNPNLALVHFWHNIALNNLGRKEEADAAMETALRLDPLSAHINTIWADRLADQDRVDEAAAYLEKAMALDPDYWVPYWHLAGLKESLGRLDEAIAILERFIDLSQDDDKILQAHTNIATGYIKLFGDYKAAQQWITKARELQITSDEVINIQIRIDLALDRNDKATDLIHQWAAENLPPVYGGYAALYEMMIGHDDHAGRLYEQVEAAPRSVNIWKETNLFDFSGGFGYLPAVNYANLLLKENKVSQANALLKTSRDFYADLKVQAPNGDYLLSSINAVEGNEQEALSALRRAIDGGWQMHWYLVRDPNLVSLREFPEFEAMVAELEAALRERRERLGQRDDTRSGGP